MPRGGHPADMPRRFRRGHRKQSGQWVLERSYLLYLHGTGTLHNANEWERPRLDGTWKRACAFYLGPATPHFCVKERARFPPLPFPRLARPLSPSRAVVHVCVCVCAFARVCTHFFVSRAARGDSSERAKVKESCFVKRSIDSAMLIAPSAF